MYKNKKIAKMVFKNTLFLFNKRLFLSLSFLRCWCTFVMSIETNKTHDLNHALMNNPVADSPIKGLLVSFRGAMLLLIGLLITTGSHAQGWELTFGGSSYDEGHAIIQTSDHGYLVVGYSESFGTSSGNPDNDVDVYVVRTDVDGTKIWSKVYDEAYFEHAYEVIETEDKGFLIVGDINYGAGQPSDVYLLKIGKKGEFEWSRTYGSPLYREQGNDVVKAAGGGYAIIGLTKETLSGDNDIQLIRIDNDGNVLWTKNYGYEGDDERGNALVALPDGGFAFVGSAKADGDIFGDMTIYRVDASGEIVWSSVFGSPTAGDEATDILLTDNGTSLVLVGHIETEGKGYLRKYDLDGNVTWFQPVQLGLASAFYAATEMADGGIVATGIVTEFPGADINVLVAKVSASGELIWANRAGSPGTVDYGYSIVNTADGGFIIGGYRDLYSAFLPDVALTKVDGSGNILTNNIRGRVYRSNDGCNDYVAGDMPLERWKVTATSADKSYITLTDVQGRYHILADTGTYTVTVLPVNPYWEVCDAAGFQANLVESYTDTILNFPVRAIIGCAYMDVQVAADFLAICESVGYTISYANEGTVVAPGAYVEVELDEELTYVSSTIAPSNINGNVYTFPLGDVNAGMRSDFSIVTSMACNGITQGQAAMVSAHIYPDTICLEPDPNWDMASIVVGGVCENDSLKFFIRNVGNGNMLQEKRYFIVEDQVVMLNAPFQLPATQEILIPVFEGNNEGATYRLIAEQSEGHPGISFPTVAIEGCSQGDYTTGFVTDFPEDDGDPFIAIDVQEVSGSGLPIALRGHPTGYHDSVLAQNTDITYTVVFRNVGTDTISRVVIRDTLSSHLDFSSLTAGPSSHPYTIHLSGEGILKITFDEIQLQPNGSAEEAQTRGFVKFRIAQKQNLPLETIIENRAAVYFDYVEPVVTNEVRYVIGCTDLFQSGCLLVITDTPKDPTASVKIKVQPNPFATTASIKIEGLQTGKTFNFDVYDITGKLVKSERFTENHFDFHRGSLAPGMYLYRLQSEGQLLGSGKILVQ